MKRYLSIPIIIATLILSGINHNIATARSSDRITGLSITEGDQLQSSLTHVSAPGYNSQGIWGQGIWCEGIEDPDCVDKLLAISAFLLPCGQDSTVGCIKEVYAVDKDGNKIFGNYLRAVAANKDFDIEEIPSRKIVAGTGTGGIWDFPGLIHSGGNSTYAVQAKLNGSGSGSAIPPAQQRQFDYQQIEFGIAAIRQVSGSFIPNKLIYVPGSTDEIRGADTIGSNGRPDFKCVQTESGFCFERANFPTGYRFGMTVSLPNKLSGWFHGRIYNPEIVITSKANGGIDIQVEALPVKVPHIREEVRSSSWSRELIDYVDANYTCNTLGDCGDTGGGFMMPGASGPKSFETANLFLPVIKDKSTGSGDYWSIRTLDFIGGNKLQECASKDSEVSGIVTTNSMVYSAGPPSYNIDSGSLDYKVLSPHYDEKMTENSGSYDLLLRSTVARCLYGFRNAPIKAEIEVFGSDGNNKVASTLIGEKDGWLFMSANGFTYSEPVVRVKLSQDPEPTPTPSPTPTTPNTSSAVNGEGSSNSTIKKKKKIICVNGAKSRKVSGIKPKCPPGFKKR
jgi:hypothetical protein